MLHPFLTADLPGIGGALKQRPEDFIVEELPAYLPSGDGEHLFLWIEKRDLAAEQLHARIARILQLSRTDVGIAGLKDRCAVARQFVSVPSRCASRVAELEAPDLHVLSAKPHRNKLRTGHLRGNLFEIIIRQVEAQALARAQAIAAVIRESGFPNYYGEQRFGIDDSTVALGFDLLAGRKHTRDIPANRRRFLLRLALSAVQSRLFNEVAADRIAAGKLHRIETGDVMQVVASRGCFVVESADAEQPRFDRRETVLTGPLFGVEMKQPSGAALQREQAALIRNGITTAMLAEYRRLIPGSRRPLLIWPEDLQIEPLQNGLRFRFTLPSGVYATTLLREFMKAEPTENDDALSSESAAANRESP